ncbi:MAG: hypothetical protein WBQ03_00915 [Candidatus Sulfotelmatobacter sp.]
MTDTESGERDRHEVLPVYFRISRGMLVPYVRVVPWQPDKKPLIANISIWPSIEELAQRPAIHRVLEEAQPADLINARSQCDTGRIKTHNRLMKVMESR